MTSPSSTISEAPCLHRVALTGGPCAGKTTALAEVSERLRSRGFGVYVVPEAATLMFGGGASFSGMNEEQVLNFQTQLLKVQMALEDAFINTARMSGKECFVICDRGACDGKAYMIERLWKRMLEENGYDIIELRDGRYDLVVHMVTAADGATAFYTLENNKMRTETIEEAIELDRKTQNAWVGHPHLRVVDNRSGFREKINCVDARISELAGIQLRRRVVRKFLIGGIGGGVKMVGGEEFLVEQTFLMREGGADTVESVRKRGKGGIFTYVHKVRKNDRETKRQIMGREYHSLMAHRDSGRQTVRIKRRCFLYNRHYFVMDVIENVEASITLLRYHCDAEDEELQIPGWLEVEREVTGEKIFSVHVLSEMAKPYVVTCFERLTEDEESEKVNKLGKRS